MTVQTSPLERLLRAKNIGLLLSGGAARCVFQIGVIETLHELGVRPSICMGVSGGAWNAAAVAVGNWRRLRAYWRFFCRMPSFDVRNLWREHSPWRWRQLHERAFQRYVSASRLQSETTLPLYVGVTRLRDRAFVVMDVKHAADPFELMLATNYLPPFYTHPPVIDGEKYGDGAYSDNAPYEPLFARGADVVVLVAQKGECEGGLMRNMDDIDHVIPDRYRDDVIVIRPRHRLAVGFVERRWDRLAPVAALGAERAREVLLGAESESAEVCSHGHPPSWYLHKVRQLLYSRDASALAARRSADS